MIIQTHRDSDISSFASRPHETDLTVIEQQETHHAIDEQISITLHDDLFEQLQVLQVI